MKKKFLALLLIVTLIAGFQSFTALAKNHESQKEPSHPIAIQGALDIEISALLNAMGKYKTKKIGMYTYYTGKIDKVPVVVSRTEMGMVNAAASTTLLIQNFKPKAIINQGTAGGADPKLHVYDIVVGDDSINYLNTMTTPRELGEGSEPEEWNMLPTDMRNDNDELVKYESFQSTPELVDVAMSVANLYKHGDVTQGRIGSGDQFNLEIDRILWTNRVLHMKAEDMETASVSQVATAFKVPFLGVRGISDASLHGEHWTTETGNNTGKWTAEYVIDIVKEMDKKVDFKSLSEDLKSAS
ncbi:5'-methylthioadenosine/S-adenosylhomocysteine nucleosidase [Bacillus gobiensis]|uniref:5'-methylthioadenosine/S-adenosylhomocysteine nucleosidase n=1 Tax=Bacillus gobiensis TaxID=1441095 RepID=UPI003D2014CD